MLVRSILTIKLHFPQTTVDDFSIFRPHVQTAEEKYLIPYLGRPTYDRLNDFLDAQPSQPSPLSQPSPEDLLLPFAQRAIVCFAYRVSVPVRNVVDTNTGFGIVQNSNLAPASRDRTNALQEGIEEYGWNAIDVMLRFLEDHRSDFPEWYDSPVSTLAFRNLINNATEFGQYVKLPEFSRVAFQSLRSVMDNVESLIISPKIGDDIFSDLKFKIKESMLTADDQKLLEPLKRALANLTLSENVPDPERRVTSPYAIFNITDVARQKYHLVGMEYLNRAIKNKNDSSPQSPQSPPSQLWNNHPPSKIFVAP